MTKTTLSVLNSISAAKKATKATAVANGGNAATIKKLIADGLVIINAATKKVAEETYSLTAAGKAAVKAAATKANA